MRLLLHFDNLYRLAASCLWRRIRHVARLQKKIKR
jgi:hypothetical protein